jgi:endonuclease/exonuclease/phosphatase family metal-dependent hydrolase
MKHFRSLVGVLVLVALIGGSGLAVFALASLEREWLLAASVISLLLGIVLVPRLWPAWRERLRVFVPVQASLLVVLACWLVLIGWSRLSPGGPPPAPKADPASIRIVTWNILHGQEGLQLSNWSGRKEALRLALQDAKPDILCVQEAVAEQVAFLERTLPTHQRVGVGRDDGRAAGEHCAILFDRERFEELATDTFWLEPPTDQPRGPSVLNVKRICTSVRLRDRRSGRILRVYNVHSYLTEKARVAAARIVLSRIAAGDPTDAIVVAGDFNATPGASSRRLFTDTGLVSSATAAGQPAGAATYQSYGVPWRSLDAILLSSGWTVRQHRLLDVKPGNTYPSDHFGVLADVTLRE